jgi:hypothetical protein
MDGKTIEDGRQMVAIKAKKPDDRIQVTDDMKQ